MTKSYLYSTFAERIGGSSFGSDTNIYKFEKIKRAKRSALQDFPDRPLLDFGIGENDEVAAYSVRTSLGEEIHKWENRGYADNGIPEFREAAARWMQREFGVSLQPHTQINHCIGSKSALAMLGTVFINPGDITLMTVPGYPIAGTSTKYCGGAVHPLPLLKENNFLPDLRSIPSHVLSRAKLLVINYPNSPTGALAPHSFFEEVVAFAQQNKIAVVNDAAHSMLSYHKSPNSFLSTPGAMDVGIEIHSMSKGFNMIGWRLGFFAGNELIVRALAEVKDNTDSGQCIAIQKAAIVALDDPTISPRIREKYARRLSKLVSVLQSLGAEVSMPGGTYFLYVSSPKGTRNGARFSSAEEASQYLIRNCSICTVPWDDAGSYLRFSATYKADTVAEEDALMDALQKRLQSDPLYW